MVSRQSACFDPENNAKLFRYLYWNLDRLDNKKEKNSKQPVENGHHKKMFQELSLVNAPSLLSNPSKFAVHASIRNQIISRLNQILFSQQDLFEESEHTERDLLHSQIVPKLPKMVSIGLNSVFVLLKASKDTDNEFCLQALDALRNILQGHAPEDLSQESHEMIQNLHNTLVDLSNASTKPNCQKAKLRIAAASSCLFALAVGRGATENVLKAVASQIINNHHQSLMEQTIKVPQNLITLQRSVQQQLYGSLTRNTWLNFGVPSQSLTRSFEINLVSECTDPGPVISIASDGRFIYLYTVQHIFVVGTGYGGSVSKYMYVARKHSFNDPTGWIGCCRDKLYIRAGRVDTGLFEFDKQTLEVKKSVILHPPIDHSTMKLFAGGSYLGVVARNPEGDTLSVRMYNGEKIEACMLVDKPVHAYNDICLQLSRKKTFILGWADFEEPERRRVLEPIESNVTTPEDWEEEEVVSIAAGAEFALLRKRSGAVYFSGKASAIGYKLVSPNFGKWSPLKETCSSKNDTYNAKKPKVIQIALGHEGAHAVLVTEDGGAVFVGAARRGEDGDSSKYRRQPKPSRPRRMVKVEGHKVVYAACNYGTTALVTKTGLLLMFGKDTQHCDASGVVTALRSERIVKVALGKAHAVALNAKGQVFTFGINNKGQCGRDFGAKDKHTVRNQNALEYTTHHTFKLCNDGDHIWYFEECMVCTLCHQCTGFGSSCQCSWNTNRTPKQKCGCGEGDSGCSMCGICKKCASSVARVNRKFDDDDEPSGSNYRNDSRGNYSGCRKETSPNYANEDTTQETERDANVRINCLPPAKLAIPGGNKIRRIDCGLHHTLLLSENGEVYTFGSNQYGQLGAGDTAPHTRLIKLKVKKAVMIAAGSNHSAIMTTSGEVYTMGSHQKGSLGRSRAEGSSEKALWYAVPGLVHRLGPNHVCRATWIRASGDQTFIHLDQSLVKTNELFSATVTAAKNTILFLPNKKEHMFKCITVNSKDGNCIALCGQEQVDFVNTSACLDPFYDVIWSFSQWNNQLKCYNIINFDAHKLQKCNKSRKEAFVDMSYMGSDYEMEYPNYGPMKRLEDFKNLETIECGGEEVNRVLSDNFSKPPSFLDPAIAIPFDCNISRMHASIHLLAVLDWLNYAWDNKLKVADCKREPSFVANLPSKDDFMVVSRFESHGGGWGYSGHSVEAIRFMCDTDILVGGYGLFGGRGDYTAKLKLFDLGPEGCDQEGDGDLIAETDEIIYECAPRDKCPVLFDNPVPILANRWYVAWACINGPSSDCGSAGQTMVVSDDIVFHFKTSKKSNNGTDVNAGQIPCLLYNPVAQTHLNTGNSTENNEPVSLISRKFYRTVTVGCFKSLLSLLQWSWNTLKATLFEKETSTATAYQKLTLRKNKERFIYILRASLRLIKSFINEVFPKNQRWKIREYNMFSEILAELKNYLCCMFSDLSIVVARNKVNLELKQRPLDTAEVVYKECLATWTQCFHALYPTAEQKWAHLCLLLAHYKENVGCNLHVRRLTASIAALCVSGCLRQLMQYVIPLTLAKSQATSISMFDSRKASSSSFVEANDNVMRRSCPNSTVVSTQVPPPVPPRAKHKNTVKKNEPIDMNLEKTLFEVLQRLLDISIFPLRRDTILNFKASNEFEQLESQLENGLAKQCCKFIVNVLSHLNCHAASKKEDTDPSVSTSHLCTPSRFGRVNQMRAWNTGNGSPDAICFTVDRPGIALVGVAVYGGVGSYDYELELLHDIRVRGSPEDGNSTYCWFSVDVAHGSYTSADCHNDVAHLKFDKPISLKENGRYVIRLCNHGGRTVNGDCGTPSVKGPDNTTFRFSTSSLSFNGTTTARGQIPYLIYTSTTSTAISSQNCTCDATVNAIRTMTLKTASLIMDNCTALFSDLRNDYPVEDLKRTANVIQSSPVVDLLIPFTLSHFENSDDAKSCLHSLEMIQALLPHVAALNQLLPSVDSGILSHISTSNYYTWVESDHPYKPATITNIRVLFPTNIRSVVIEIDPRSGTGQPEDTLTVYASGGENRSDNHCHCTWSTSRDISRSQSNLHLLPGNTSESSLLEESVLESPCLDYNCTYYAVTPRLANNPQEWPKKALIVPGNEVIFSLETASDYINDFKGNWYGLRALVVGYDQINTNTLKCGLSTLEMELAYCGGACARKLMSPELQLPSSYPAPVTEEETQAEPDDACSECDENSKRELYDANAAFLLSRGLEITTPPTAAQVINGQHVERPLSNERQFLSDLIKGVETTSGGRLACWLQPDSRVDPAKSGVVVPKGPICVGSTIPLDVCLKDQYDDYVKSSFVKIQITISICENDEADTRRNRRIVPDASTYGGNPPPPADSPFKVMSRDSLRFQAISMMPEFQNYSFEEIRLAAPVNMEAPWTPPEKLVIKCEQGCYSTTWTPRIPGCYKVQCVLDDRLAQEISVTAVEASAQGGVQILFDNTAKQTPNKSTETQAKTLKIRRVAIEHSRGVRIRANPSLQGEQIGIVPNMECITFTEEVHNSDGTWVRLTEEAAKYYIHQSAGTSSQAPASVEISEAWCLQFHHHLGKMMFESVEFDGDISYTDDGSISKASSWSDDMEQSSKPDTSSTLLKIEINKGLSLSDGGDEMISVFGKTTQLSDSSSSNEQLSSYDRAQENCSKTLNGNKKDEDWPQKEDDTLTDELVQQFDHEVCFVNVSEDITTEKWVRVMQTGTQTSPVTGFSVFEQGNFSKGASTKEDKSPRNYKEARSRSSTYSPKAASKSSKGETCAESCGGGGAGGHSKVKEALSPLQAESLRATFASLLWHEGIVHDAMACAAFLKFYPQLPKSGVEVMTRNNRPYPGDAESSNQERHSVEISTGHYLRIQPSCLESLTRSAQNANANRRGKRISGVPAVGDISEEGTDHKSEESHSVSVLPPALRALVALWDALCRANIHNTVPVSNLHATSQPGSPENRKPADMRGKKVASCNNFAEPTVECELCNGASVTSPLATHMQGAHPGCGLAEVRRGYGRSGTYSECTATAPCGQTKRTAFYIWYILCEACHTAYKRDVEYRAELERARRNANDKSEALSIPSTRANHFNVLDNAMFLLELSPAVNFEQTPNSSYYGVPFAPASPPFSSWLPAPQLQCLAGLGAKVNDDESKLSNIADDFIKAHISEEIIEESLKSGRKPLKIHNKNRHSGVYEPPLKGRFHRSISMGQTSDLASDLTHNLRRPRNNEENIEGAGSSLLAQPSPALHKLLSTCMDDEDPLTALKCPRLNVDSVTRRPVVTFVCEKRDLDLLRRSLEGQMQRAVVNRYATEAFNWLLRSVTQPTCLHDVMWWFCSALEPYAKHFQAIDEPKRNKDFNEPIVSTDAVAIGGKIGRGVKAALYTFLQSVSDLMLHLNHSSPILLQAVRCWAVQCDQTFLHRSQVFNVISKILSRSDDEASEENVTSLMPQDSIASCHTKDSYLWHCPDLTSWCEVQVSSRQGMAGALTDGTTETFWESGDEDRGRTKWVQVVCPSGVLSSEKPFLISLHVDNTRDTLNKTLLVTFLFSSPSNDLFHMQEVEIDGKTATWACYNLPRNAIPPFRVRCELRGPDQAVRVRQLKVFGVTTLRSNLSQATIAQSTLATNSSSRLILREYIEAETLRVFRLITSQVFGKLLECEKPISEGSSASPVSTHSRVTGSDAEDETELREHVVGILFARSTLTHLQQQVMTHIVTALGFEASKSRLEWESSLNLVESDDSIGETPTVEGRGQKDQHNYCFEMLSLVLALSGSTVGRRHLAERSELVADLLSLLHTGSGRVQRQVILLLRRMIGEITPQQMLVAISNFGEMTQTRRQSSRENKKVSLIDVLVMYVCKAIQVQVKVKGNTSGLSATAQGVGNRPPWTLAKIGCNVSQPPPRYWFMRGTTLRPHAHEVAKLLSDMLEEKLGPQWASETRSTLLSYTAGLSCLTEEERSVNVCLESPALWLAFGSLCIIEQGDADTINSGTFTIGEANSKNHNEQNSPSKQQEVARPFCSNHDDGETLAVIVCEQCGPLCPECDRFLHLKRSARMHRRQICKEEELSIKIDIHEGCGRVKLFWLLLLIDRRTYKALAEFRNPATGGVTLVGEVDTIASATVKSRLTGVCRFCGVRGSTGLLAIGNVCADKDCQEHTRDACTRVLDCGHVCGGVRGEPSCLPCLHGCSNSVALRQDADDMCMICFTDPLSAAPAVQLKCNHVFHLHCCKQVLNNKWNGPRITFAFSQCPICKEDMQHWSLEELVAPIRQLQEEVKRKALMRLEYEGLGGAAAIPARYRNEPVAYAMDKYAYYACFKCGKAYFGGEARCDADAGGSYDPAELLCGACSDVAGARICHKHGADFLEYKCRYCCSVAVFFCFGTSHFCNSCHDDFQRVTNIPMHELPVCPAGPKASQLPGTVEDCPLHIEHPPTGEEFALGCGVCRNAHTF